MSERLNDELFAQIEARLQEEGWLSDDTAWSENCRPPDDPQQFAAEAIFVICNSGMKNTVARRIYDRVIDHVKKGGSARNVFGHLGKCDAIDVIWARRQEYFDGFMAANDKVAFCETLPWIGGITKYHLAKNFGAQVAKPDVHLQRLADLSGETPQALCERLACSSGWKIATVDLMLWRACATGIMDSRTMILRDPSGREEGE